MSVDKITKRESKALLNSLGSGVVPRIGLRHIAVGRKNEIQSFLNDLETVEEKGSSFRIIGGEFGSGKSFMIQTIRNNALERDFVVMDTDLSPEKRLTGSKGQGLSTYRDLLQSTSTKTRSEGALETILLKWSTAIQNKVKKEHNVNPASGEFDYLVEEEIEKVLKNLQEMKYGYAFTEVLKIYWKGKKTDNADLVNAALRWIRGEYSTITKAKKDLPVDLIIKDDNWYDFLKLFAKFVTQIGYKGLLVFFDEGVNLYKIPNRVSRENNYEKILTMFNDLMQGKAESIGVFLSGTPEFIYDENRGIFSYEALRSRLKPSEYQLENTINVTGPIVELLPLDQNEVFLLLRNLCRVHSANYNYETTLTDKDLQKFMTDEYSREGSETKLMPREIIRDFINILNTLYENKEYTMDMVLDNKSYVEKPVEDDVFASFDI